MPFTLLTGGARSGKSSIAARLAAGSGLPVTFVATAGAGDAEMAERIARHRADRPAGWATIEEQEDLLGALGRVPGDDFVVVDCLTLWVSNLLGRGDGEDSVRETAATVARALASRAGESVVVTNEVGWGIVPENDLARRYRDLLGAVNQAFAEEAERVLLVVAGRVLPLETLVARPG